MKIVIVGGVAGGATAAARIRRLDENAEIIILSEADMFPTQIADSLTISEEKSLTKRICFYRLLKDFGRDLKLM